MDKFKQVSPGRNTQFLLTLAAIDTMCPTLLGNCIELVINPFDIERVTKMPCVPPERKRYRSKQGYISVYTRENERYQIVLKDGSQAICEYEQTGPESGQIDACIELPGKHLPLPIAINNFFVARHYYEAATLSDSKLD